MEQAGRQSWRMVLVLMVSAVFCAVATFVAVRLLIDRSNPQVVQFANLEEVTVDGMVIRIDIDPEKAVYMPQELEQGGAPETPPPQAPTPTQAPEAVAGPTATPQPTSTPPPPTAAPDSVIFKDYVVQQGDSLYSIGDRQNSSIELMALHGIDSDDMVPGTDLWLPYANPAYCPGNRAYVVRDHDTIFGIATAFNTTPQAIAQLNNLDASYTIRVTQVICIPVG
jgi:LysM repeat protein